MPKLIVEGYGEYEVPEGKKLTLALLDEVGVDQLHACGGNSKCTTCRVEFITGEPEDMSELEKAALEKKGFFGQARLSCQIRCDNDMSVRILSRLEGSGRADAGKRPED